MLTSFRNPVIASKGSILLRSIGDPRVRLASNKRTVIDRSKVPILDEHDLEEKYVSGHGPGGQKVNKSVNCCQLTHKPTGIVVKVHQSRLLSDNRKIARELLIEKLDNLYNGEDSVMNQKHRIAMRKAEARDANRERLKILKQSHRELIANDSSGDHDVRHDENR